jgi:hypothetical protein
MKVTLWKKKKVSICMPITMRRGESNPDLLHTSSTSKYQEQPCTLYHVRGTCPFCALDVGDKSQRLGTRKKRQPLLESHIRMRGIEPRPAACKRLFFAHQKQLCTLNHIRFLWLVHRFDRQGTSYIFEPKAGVSVSS